MMPEAKAVCAEARYFWEGDALGTSHLILIISVLEAQVLEMNYCSPAPSRSSAVNTASYESSSSLGAGGTLQKSAGAPQCGYTARRSSVSSSEQIWLVLKVAEKDKLARWESNLQMNFWHLCHQREM